MISMGYAVYYRIPQIERYQQDNPHTSARAGAPRASIENIENMMRGYMPQPFDNIDTSPRLVSRDFDEIVSSATVPRGSTLRKPLKRLKARLREYIR